MYNKIYVFSPTGQATGGTELLQQLVYKLRQFGKNAYLVYTNQYEDSKVKEVFEPRYNNPYVEKVEDEENNLIIASEACLYLLLNYKRVQKAAWWLSVDFYGGSFRLPCDAMHKVFYTLSDAIYRQFDKQWIHLVQSEYAYKYCIEERHIPQSNVYRLSDYLSRDFIVNADINVDQARENQVLYNPKKGVEFTQKLISLYSEIKWIPIINMNSKQIVELMKSSKLYIDFGNHPGKDRIPREAAICGCCVITGKRGSAANEVDIPIPSKYKFEETRLSEIKDCINDIFMEFDKCKKDYIKYVDKIKNEEVVFEQEVKNVFISNPHKVEILPIYKQMVRPFARIVAYSMKFGPTLFGYNK